MISSECLGNLRISYGFLGFALIVSDFLELALIILNSLDFIMGPKLFGAIGDPAFPCDPSIPLRFSRKSSKFVRFLDIHLILSSSWKSSNFIRFLGIPLIFSDALELVLIVLGFLDWITDSKLFGPCGIRHFLEIPLILSDLLENPLIYCGFGKAFNFFWTSGKSTDFP